MDTYLPSLKPFKSDEQDIMSSKVTSFCLNPFTDAYCQDNAKCIAGIMSDIISFRDVIQLHNYSAGEVRKNS